MSPDSQATGVPAGGSAAFLQYVPDKTSRWRWERRTAVASAGRHYGVDRSGACCLKCMVWQTDKVEFVQSKRANGTVSNAWLCGDCIDLVHRMGDVSPSSADVERDFALRVQRWNREGLVLPERCPADHKSKRFIQADMTGEGTERPMTAADQEGEPSASADRDEEEEEEEEDEDVQEGSERSQEGRLEGRGGRGERGADEMTC